MGSQRYVGSAWGGPCHAMRVGGRRPTASETKYVYLFFRVGLDLWSLELGLLAIVRVVIVH